MVMWQDGNPLQTLRYLPAAECVTRSLKGSLKTVLNKHPGGFGALGGHDVTASTTSASSSGLRLSGA
jgi:hypothetical protein